MSTNSSNQTPPAEAPQTEPPAPGAEEQPSEFQQQVEAAKGDPDKLAEILTSMASQLSERDTKISSLNHESMERRKRLKELETQEAERKKSEMTEIERAQAEAEDYKTQLEKERSSRTQLEAKLAFNSLGASDADSVLLHWQALDADSREQTTPEAFAQELKKKKPHLFGVVTNTGPNPNGDGAGGNPKPKPINPNPSNRTELRVIDDAWASLK